MNPTPALTTPAPDRPWPVVLLTALGAWLATIPLAGMVALLLGDLMVSGVGPYVTGPLLLVGACVVLRSPGVGLFVEQLAVPVLLLGGITLGFGLYRDLPPLGASLGLAAVALGVGLWLRGAWLPALLGAAACALVLIGVVATHHRFLPGGLWLAAQGCAVLWAVLASVRRQPGTPLDTVGSGWVLAALAGLAFGSGMTFLVGALVDVREAGMGMGWHTTGLWTLWSGVSVVLTAAGGVVLARRWPSLRRGWATGVVAVAMGLAWFLPTLGAVWLVAALCATQARPLLAAAAGVAAVWIVGAFYYQLAWPLATKAAVLVGAGAALGLLAWWGHRVARVSRPAAPDTPARPDTLPDRPRRLAIALCAAAVLVVANAAIWQKEALIAQGRPVFVELAPVDPRSLMQGDYMALNYRLGDTLRRQLDDVGRLERPVALAIVDARGVARLERLVEASDPATPVPGTLRLQLTPKGGRWVLVSDAWFFQEGDGERWEAARYGEFRVMPDGRALLVGLADVQLKAIASPRQ